MAIKRLCDEKKIKRTGRGLYRKIRKVSPINWLLVDETESIDLSFPKGRKYDNTVFGFEGVIQVSPGDLIVISGVSNTGKSAFVLNMLAENVDKLPCVVMGNEYTNADKTPNRRFKRRMMSMDWVNWVNGDGMPRFDLYPVMNDYEDYVQPNKINIIDWISIDGEKGFFVVGKILEAIKTALGKGVAIVALQKGKGAELGIGGQFTEHLADVYLSIDPLGEMESRITVGKVKDSLRNLKGKMWGFKISDNGSTFSNIREIEFCRPCKGKGLRWNAQEKQEVFCFECSGTGYKTKETSIGY